MTLNTELAALFDGIKAKAPPPVIDKAVAIFDRLEAAHVGEKAPKPGDKAPDVHFTTMDNAAVSLSGIVENGAVVLMFYRGRWCPFCDLTLKAFDKEAGAFKSAGARLIAVSPQTVEESQKTAAERNLSIEVLSDPHNASAKAFGIAWSLTTEEKELHKAFGSMLDAANGDDRWELPAPAIFVIDRTGFVRWSHVDPNHTRRAEPSEVLAAVKELRPA